MEVTIHQGWQQKIKKICKIRKHDVVDGDVNLVKESL